MSLTYAHELMSQFTVVDQGLSTVLTEQPEAARHTFARMHGAILESVKIVVRVVEQGQQNQQAILEKVLAMN